MVSTQDSESCDPSSNLGGTCTNLLNYEKRCKHNFKNEAPARFELAISCLLDRRFNQLSHGAGVVDKLLQDAYNETKYMLWGKKVSPNVGLEPTTLRLRVSCSTD